MAGEGKYIYCITEDGQGETFGPLGIGGRGDQLRAIHYRDIGAVVTDAAIRRYPVSRENSLAHERAIEAVFKGHTVLPVRFCTIAEDEAKVRAILEREYAEFTGLLERMRGKVELGLKAIFHEELIYQDILEEHEEIKRRKAAVAAMPQQEAHWQLVAIGRMVDRPRGREGQGPGGDLGGPQGGLSRLPPDPPDPRRANDHERRVPGGSRPGGGV